MLLDCTFRDGGYYTNWEFDDDLVSQYLHAVELAGVDVVEIGYRSLRNQMWSGYLFYSPDHYLNKIASNTTVDIAVMIDAADIISEGVEATLSFFPENHEIIKIVRVAAHKFEVETCLEFMMKLKELGYKTCLNLMGFQQYNEKELSDRVGLLDFCEAVDVLYFADSFGAMSYNDVKESVALLQKYWKGDIGFHAHNNQGAALLNAVTAIDCGVLWIDSTVTGMGRGAGNLATEEILIHLNRGEERYDPVPMFSVIHDYFDPLKKIEGWGSSIAYGIAALNGMHPTYIQKLHKKDYSSKQMVNCLKYLQSSDAVKYRDSLFQGAQNYIVESAMSGSKQYNYKRKDKVLLVGASAYKRKYKHEFKELIDSGEYFVISLNDQGLLAEDVDLYVSINSKRVGESKKLYESNKDKVLITPQANENDIDGLMVESMSYGVGEFSFVDSIVIPDNDVFWFGLAVALKMNPSQIALFGIEKPYKDSSFDQLLERALGGVECVSLGKTSFGVKSLSIVGLLQGVV